MPFSWAAERPLRNLQRVVDGLPLRDRAGVELAAQRLAFQQLRDRIGGPVLGSEVVDREDVRMRQRRDRLRLALEPRQRVGSFATESGRTLIATSRSSFAVARPVDLSHPARAERREDLVRPEARSSSQSQCDV